MNKAISLILKELELAESKHPRWPTDLLRQTTIVAEELGEAQRAALSIVELQDEPNAANAERLIALNYELDREMAQTAAMCLRFLMERQ